MDRSNILWFIYKDKSYDDFINYGNNKYGEKKSSSIYSTPYKSYLHKINPEKYIDRIKQYEKGFEKSIGTLMELSGWTVEKKQTLSGLFMK